MGNSSPKTPFSKWLAAQSKSIAGLPTEWHSFARRLSSQPHLVAPNSPVLAKLAEAFDIPLEELQKFAKHKPMSERFVKKIEGHLAIGVHSSSQMGKGAKKAGRSGAPGNRGGVGPNPKTAVGKLIRERGFLLSEVAKDLGLPISALWRISGGLLPPNHPQLAAVADHVGIPASELGKMMIDQTPMKGGHLEKAQSQMEERHPASAKGAKGPRGAKNGKPGKAVVLASVAVPSGNGHRHPAPNNGGGNGGGGGKYNRIRKAELHLRQSARAMVATLNVTIMRGDTHMPPLPVGDLYLVLQDYLQEKGIKENVLVDPNFGTVFDPR